MNKTVQTCVVLLLLGIIVSSAVAEPTVYVTKKWGYYSGPGGEFTLYAYGVPGLEDGTSIQTFCLEYNEYINSGIGYTAVVNTMAVNGGVGFIGDPISYQTAFLYSAFLDGALADYGYEYTPGAGRSASAAALQDVIWYLEGERPKTWTTDSFQEVLYQAAMKECLTGISDIRVLNLYEDGELRQDQLVRVIVPLPTAVLLGGIGVALVGWMRGRRMF